MITLEIDAWGILVDLFFSFRVNCSFRTLSCKHCSCDRLPSCFLVSDCWLCAQVQLRMSRQLWGSLTKITSLHEPWTQAVFPITAHSWSPFCLSSKRVSCCQSEDHYLCNIMSLYWLSLSKANSRSSAQYTWLLSRLLCRVSFILPWMPCSRGVGYPVSHAMLQAVGPAP